MDPAYVTLRSVALTDQQYTLGGQSMDYTHDAFLIVTIPIEHSLCGSLTYEAEFNAVSIDASSEPMSYDSTTSKFMFYSEDVAYVGDQAFTLSAFMTDYVDNGVVKEEAILTVIAVDPCENPTSVTKSFMTPQ